MTSNAIVARVIATLEAHNIPHMLVGAYSVNAYGIERSTQDADFVIELGDQSMTGVADALLPDIILDPQLSFESVTLSQRFIAVHRDSGFKVEFFLRQDEPFHRERFARRAKGKFLDREAWMQTAEDLIVQKLRWYKRVKRNKDIDDARNVLAVQLGKLDYAYIRRWCDQHGTRELFEALYEESKQFE